MAGTKLELTWPGKENRPRLEPRILVEEPELSYHAAARVTEGDVFDNVLIQGDNLLALKALEAEYGSKVKCIFIDPPYNTGSAFTHYDDGMEHSLWLSMMRDRLEHLKVLLSEEGSLWITVDDNEAHYLKVLCDGVLGRENFVANVVWQKRTSPDFRATLGSGHDHVLVYAKSLDIFRTVLKKLPKSPEQEAQYKNPDKDSRGPWVSSDYTAQGFRPNQMYTINTPAGVEYRPPEGYCWKNIEHVFLGLVADNRIWFGKDGKAVPRRKTFLSESEGQTAWTWWPNSEVGHNQEAKKEILNLFDAENAFDTPKPERLLHRVLSLCTEPGDLVLDSFAGSGTTGAVAQKMGRRWIMVELGDHAVTHIVPRMRKVADGTDGGGISKAVDWKGGGGFRFYRLAPSLLKEDRWGNYVINPAYNAEMLAQAVCLHEGYVYAPSETEFWMHGRANESSFLYVTTGHLTPEQLQALSDEVGPSRSLRVLCTAFSGGAGTFDNLEVKKIPSEILGRCEWDHDDYSLQVANLPMREEEFSILDSRISKGKSKGESSGPEAPSLFREDDR